MYQRSISASEVLGPGPDFWFLLEPARLSWGLGFFDAPPALMAAFRGAVDANPARFRRLASAAEAKGFALGGPEYKRPKGDRGALLNRWYNRKYVNVEFGGDFGGELFSPELPQTLCSRYEALVPLHDFLLEVYESSREEERA